MAHSRCEEPPKDDGSFAQPDEPILILQNLGGSFPSLLRLPRTTMAAQATDSPEVPEPSPPLRKSPRLPAQVGGVDRLHLLHKNPPPRPAEPLQHTEDQRAAERDRVRVQFDRIDADDSGTIGAGDLAQELERLHLPFTTEDLHDILEHADAYNGEMGFNEFYEYYTTRELQLREVFEATDLGGDGRLHCKEVQASMVQLGFSVSRKEVGQMMKRLESDEDGCVTWEAWRELLVLLPHTHCEELFSSWQDSTAVWQPSIPSGQDKWGKNGVWIQHFCSGALAGVVSRTATAPLDRLKILLQANAHRPSDSRVGIRASFGYMLQEGGWRSLWRGNGVNVLKIAPESAIKFLAWEAAKQLLYDADDFHHPSFHHRLLAGSFAGVVAQTSIFPMEVLKTRLATGKTGQYTGIFGCARQIIKVEGVRTFYRGLTPALLGVVPYAGIDLAVYETLKTMYMDAHATEDPSVPVLLACGAVSCTCGQLASYPLALVRTRLQAEPGNTNTMRQEFKVVYRQGGIRALYFGMAANVLKVVPAVSISYAIYETSKKAWRKSADKVVA